MNGCRIGRVRMKAGGAPVQLMPLERKGDPDVRRRLVEGLEWTAAEDAESVGVVLTKEDGTVNIGWGGPVTSRLVCGVQDLAFRLMRHRWE